MSKQPRHDAATCLQCYLAAKEEGRCQEVLDQEWAAAMEEASNEAVCADVIELAGRLWEERKITYQVWQQVNSLHALLTVAMRSGVRGIPLDLWPRTYREEDRVSKPNNTEAL